MNAEQKFFLKTLEDHIREEKTSVPDSIDLELVKNYAQSHQLEPFFYYQTGNALFREAYYAQIIMYDIRASVADELFGFLSDIPFFILKGIKVAKFYPVKELRTMGDIDLLVHLEDREEVDKRLIEHGFELVDKLTGEWEYLKNGVLIELHTALVYKYSKSTTDRKLQKYFNNCWDYYHDGELDFNFHVLFLFMHLRKHIMETGVGFRQFLDLAVLTLRADLDWEWIRKEAEKLDLFSFIEMVMAFNQRCFNVPSPFSTDMIDDPFVEKAVHIVFDDGVFGFENDDNQFNRAINEWKKTGNRFARTGVFFKHVLWPYEKMITMPEYSWLRGKKYLLPLAWINRAARKSKEWRRLKNRYYASKSIADERYAYLQRWGIHNEKDQPNG